MHDNRIKSKAMNEIANRGIETYLTIEPIMAFDKDDIVRLIRMCRPTQVNIGANTYNKIRIPEPTKQEIIDLVNEIKDECKVELKENLNRIIT